MAKFQRSGGGGAGFTTIEGEGNAINFGTGAGSANFFAGVDGGADNFFRIDSTDFRVQSGMQIGFSSHATNPESGTLDTYIYRNAANVLRTPGNLLIDGNVGIGTTSPGSILSVQSVGNFQSGTSTLYSGLVVPGFNATSSGIVISGGALQLTSGATSTFNNGISLSGGCFSDVNGTCVSSNATTLDGVDSLSFLRSDTSDNFTSGTLTFNSGTVLNLANVGLSSALLALDNSGNVVSTSSP